MKNVLWVIGFLVSAIVFYGCQNGGEQSALDSPLKIKEIITHNYTFKMVGGEPRKDSVKECFSCNLGLEFDEMGREIILRFYKADLDSLYGYEVYKYNELGQKIGSDYYENDSVVTAYVYELDSLGRKQITRAIDKRTGKMLYGYRYRYDEQGLPFETGNLNADGEVYEYYRQAYNEFGVITTEEIVDLEGNPTFEVRYEYRPKPDSNWVDQITYHNGRLNEIRHREILYFN